jgi:hypothetical protein
MKTASHFAYTGPGRISISLGTPRRAPAGYRIFRILAPKREWMNAPAHIYVPRFRDEVLAPLDPRKVWDELHRLAGDAEPILQCYERPPFDTKTWCHRRLVAQYFEQELGEKVPELNYDGPDYCTVY